jgi:hypothetical protein
MGQSQLTPAQAETTMALTPHMSQQVQAVVQRAAKAAHGQKGTVYESACKELGINLATLHRYMAQVSVRPQRKQRSDAGAVSLTRDEAAIISAYMMASIRKNGKRLLSLGQALEQLRANNEVRAERTDPATGEVTLLSESAVASALRHYGMHPDQLNRPSPAVELRSLHPNHVWQIDASMCVLYYLHTKSDKEAGLQVMDRDRFYKNKPANLKRIEHDRVWSYEWTDHYSGAIGVHYVLGAESAINLIDSFLFAIIKRAMDPFHGVPRILMMDMGSANTSGSFGNLARRLGVELIAHAPGNARATGQVEKARDLIEKGFESALRFAPVHGLDDLNAQAQRWATWFNAHRLHSRHGRSRYALWMTITEDQLRIAPPLEHCRALVNDQPEGRKVTDKLRVNYRGKEYDVSGLPGVMIGETLQLALNPWQVEGAVVVCRDANGQEVMHAVPEVAKDDAGFATTANVIGEEWRSAPQTILEANRSEVKRVAMDASTDAEAEAKTKAKALPFGGRIDPFKPIDQAAQHAWLPRQGKAVAPSTATGLARQVQIMLTVPDAVRRIRTAYSEAGQDTPADLYTSISAAHPDGNVPHEYVEAWETTLHAPAAATGTHDAQGSLRRVK